jgi:parallel beta-helix repeat protein
MTTGAGGIIANNHIEASSTANTYGIKLDRTGALTISGNTIRTTYYGVYLLNGASPVINGNNTITANSYGIMALGDRQNAANDPMPLVNNNAIHGNSYKNYHVYNYADATRVLDAGNNWWGTTDLAVIAGNIYDSNDSAISSPTVNIDPILLSPVVNLLAASRGVFSGATDLSVAELQSVVEAALQRWLASGLVTTAELRQFDSVNFHIVDLPGLLLGQNDGNVIRIDTNAAGHGWFVDKTPLLDEEFIVADNTDQSVLEAKAHTNASGAMDLVSVVSHELGHLFGFAHNDVVAAMSDTLDAGIRQLPVIATGKQEIDIAAQDAFVEAINYKTIDLIDVSRHRTGTLTATSLSSQEIPHRSVFVTGIEVTEWKVSGGSEAHTKPVRENFSSLKRPTAVAASTENHPATFATPPQIDWTLPILDKDRDNTISDSGNTKPEAGKKAGSWLKEFLGNLAGAQGKNPNDAIKISIPEETAAVPAKRKEEE